MDHCVDIVTMLNLSWIFGLIFDRLDRIMATGAKRSFSNFVFFVVVAVNVDYTMVIVLAAAVVVVRSIAGWFFFSFFFPIGSTFWIDIGCDFSSGSLAIFLFSLVWLNSSKQYLLDLENDTVKWKQKFCGGRSNVAKLSFNEMKTYTHKHNFSIKQSDKVFGLYEWKKIIGIKTAGMTPVFFLCH